MKRLIAIAGLVLVSARLGTAADLETYKGTYEKTLLEIILTNGEEAKKLKQGYSKSLDVLLAKVKKSGDLQKTMAVMKEIERVEKGQPLPEKPSGVPEIQTFQSAYAEQAAALDLKKARQVLALTAKYDQALERLQRSLVSSDKLTDAQRVQDERQRVQASELVSNSKSAIAAYKPPKEDKTPPGARPNPPSVTRPRLRPTQSVFGRSGARFRVREGRVKGLRTGCTLYTDRDHTLKERPKPLSSTSYVLAPFGGCRVVCEKSGVAFALGLFDVHNQGRTKKVETYLKDENWTKAEDVPDFVLYYTNGADRTGKLYWKEIKLGEELSFPDGAVLCFKNR